MAEPDAGSGALRAGLPGRLRGLVYCAYGLILVAVLVDLSTGPGSTLSPVLACVPVLAGAGSRSPRVPATAGVLAAACAGLLSRANRGVPLAVHLATLTAIAAVTLASIANALLARARERELVQVRTVAEAAQLALLRPVPARAGALRIAVRYVAAAAEARIGGDLYEVLETDHGVRILLGDVQGKGLAAVEAAADVLGAFREAARSEPELARVAERLDEALARRTAAEQRFATAVLLSVPAAAGPVELVNCGHPPPLLRHRSRAVTALDPPAFAPPLGLRALTGEHYRARTFELHRGDLLLLYTDGVAEARDAAGEFYPLPVRLADGLTAPEPDALLGQLLADVRDWTAGGLGDDAAVLALRREF
ncbi:PP2C family protein-serine/threonine phosphatase [Kitasatospora sp. NPDC006697]|uniref:PP2C family protein-serine/threonine phosphatase n=1 Tax=Kitasatospora sp. NPDC006697 TaxID=3364020 RepID=UPI0036A86D88